jgi:hypothetical protein
MNHPVWGKGKDISMDNPGVMNRYQSREIELDRYLTTTGLGSPRMYPYHTLQSIINQTISLASVFTHIACVTTHFSEIFPFTENPVSGG